MHRLRAGLLQDPGRPRRLQVTTLARCVQNPTVFVWRYCTHRARCGTSICTTYLTGRGECYPKMYKQYMWRASQGERQTGLDLTPGKGVCKSHLCIHGVSCREWTDLDRVVFLEAGHFHDGRREELNQLRAPMHLVTSLPVRHMLCIYG